MKLDEHSEEYWELIKLCGHIADVLQSIANAFVAESVLNKVQGPLAKSFVEGKAGSSRNMNRLQQVKANKDQAFTKSLKVLHVLFTKGLVEVDRLIKYEEEKNA